MTETELLAPETTPEVVAALVENHREFLRFVERRVGSRALAEEILQEAFVRGLHHGHEIEGSVVGWFYGVLRHAVIDHHRRRKSADRRLEAFAAELDAQGEPDEAAAAAACACVLRLAGGLKAEYADALRQIDVQGVPVKDYAAASGISSSNAGVRIFRARAALRREVARSCGTCAEHGCLDCSCDSAAGGCA
ncbi:MAG TPA: RNA polymerase sigma factor [Polyangiaceae bacterium]|jgi:RNA polymerase sigma-70 factor (ECF subfamily)|nr:RNA polymerase sigma factor [Polyangiaceae bacterium]